MLAAQPQAVRQDLSQVKAQVESTPSTRGVLGGSALCFSPEVPSEMSNTESQPKAENCSKLHSFLCSLGHCPSGRQGWFLALDSSIFLGICSVASRLRGPVGGVCSRPTQPESLLLRDGGDLLFYSKAFFGPCPGWRKWAGGGRIVTQQPGF